jgi:hypothetical protein
MTELRYPLSALAWDYARGIAGILICIVILITNEWHNQLLWLFVGLTILFAIYTMTTIAKNLAWFRVSEEGIECGGFRRQSIRWGELSELALRYYPTSRSRKKGWMTLSLRAKVGSGGGPRQPGRVASMKIDSQLPGFPEIATRAAWAAKENNLLVDKVTADNLAALGVSA